MHILVGDKAPARNFCWHCFETNGIFTLHLYFWISGSKWRSVTHATLLKASVQWEGRVSFLPLIQLKLVSWEVTAILIYRNNPTQFGLSSLVPYLPTAEVSWQGSDFFFLWIRNCVASSAVCEVIFHSDYENLSSLPLMVYVHLPAWRHWYLFCSSELLDHLIVLQLKKVSENKYSTFRLSIFLKQPCQLCRRWKCARL